MTGHSSNINMLWAETIVEELVRSGVTRFIAAPGSRSSPLTVAAARNERASVTMHYDERGAAFFALGFGKAGRIPACWITTSGTAVANGLPAVVEAHQSAVPLVLLTADRPPELRDTGANQAIDQTKIFGGFVRWFHELPCPDPAIDPTYVLTTVDQAVQRAIGRPGGPTHLNCPFREPLTPVLSEEPLQLSPSFERWLTGGKPYMTQGTPALQSDLDTFEKIAARITASSKGVVVVGALSDGRESVSIMRLAEALGWPVLADIASDLRTEGFAKHVLAYPDLVARIVSESSNIEVATVLRFGDRITSKALQRWIGRMSPSTYAAVTQSPERSDPFHRLTHRSFGSAKDLLLAIEKCEPTINPDWLTLWESLDSRCRTVVQAIARDDDQLSEPLIAAILPDLLPHDHSLFLGSSMPVRDFDSFAGRSDEPLRVAANRGASGIDGTIASAAGFAASTRAPVTCVLGDVATLHDLNSLKLLNEATVVLIVLNNDGGGIFHHLPISDYEDVFERYFATPHGLYFEGAARMFELAYAQPNSTEAFVSAYLEACDRGQSCIIELVTDRSLNRALHRTIESDLLRSTTE